MKSKKQYFTMIGRMWILMVLVVSMMCSPLFAYQQTDSLNIKVRNDLKKLKPRKKLKLADKEAKKGNLLTAMVIYEDYLKTNEGHSKTISMLAEINYMLRDYKTAATYYKTLKEQESLAYPKAGYYYALMLKYTGDYENAKAEFESFMNSYKGDDKEEMKRLCQKHIEGCDFALSAMNNPQKVEIEHLDENINQPFTDYAPRPVENGLLYSSLRSDTVIAINIAQEKNVDYYSKLYTAKKLGNTFTKGQPLPGPFNAIGFHTGNGCYSPDGKRFYFTRCTEENSVTMNCKIYVSEKVDGQWQEPVELDESINKKPFSSTHPFPVVGNDGKEVLFFTSNRDGGKGGTDIWYAVRKADGSYENPVNLGEMINTSRNEMTPYYDAATSTLYFSSDGHVSMGGMDIFTSTGWGTQWSEPVNVGYPINSSVDDMYYVPDENGEDAYMVSNRPGVFSLKSETCCDDIFRVKFIRDVFLRGYVATRKAPKVPIEGVRVKIFDLGENEQINLVAELVTTPNEKFIIKIDPEKDYRVNSTKEGYMSGVEDLLFSQVEITEDTIDHIFYIEPVRRKRIRIPRVYFPFDKADIVDVYREKLDSLFNFLSDNPQYKIQITGHTDFIGTEQYNENLSKRRAQSAANYLISKGLDKNRIQLDWKGELDPIAPNTMPDGSDNPVGRAKNRRVEFKLIAGEETIEIKYVDNEPVEKVIDRKRDVSNQ